MERITSFLDIQQDIATEVVVSVQSGRKEKVFNLKTLSGMYLANGILVSNCDAVRYCLMMDDKPYPQGISVYRPPANRYGRGIISP